MLVLHFVVAIYAVGGALLVLLDPWHAVPHIVLVLWVAIVNLARRTCPLTPLEQHLRARSGQRSYTETWTQHYFEPLLRRLGRPRRLELTIGVSVLAWNALLYAWLLLRQSG